MKQHITDQKTGISYTLHSDYYELARNKVPGHPSEISDFVDGSGSYYLPDLSLPAEEEISIGVWGERHKQFLKNHQRGIYNEFLISGVDILRVQEDRMTKVGSYDCIVGFCGENR